MPFLAENVSAMSKMMVDMGITPSGDVDRDFVAMMVPHHQGAIDMAQAELRYGHNEQLRRMAQEIIVTQQEEIAAMRLAVGEPLPPSAPALDQNPARCDEGSKSSLRQAISARSCDMKHDLCTRLCYLPRQRFGGASLCMGRAGSGRGVRSRIFRSAITIASTRRSSSRTLCLSPIPPTTSCSAPSVSAIRCRPVSVRSTRAKCWCTAWVFRPIITRLPWSLSARMR